MQELWDLAVRYARGCDRRDSDLFVSAFASDARLEVHNPTGSTPAVRTGADLPQIPVKLGRYDATFHMLGQASYDVEPSGTAATGEVYCMAHHITRGAEESSDHVMFIRYGDDYVRGDDGTWRIAVRRVQVDWTERRPLEA